MSEFPAPKKTRVLRSVAMLPTLLTLANGMCGFGAIISASQGHRFLTAAWLIFAAMIFDALDGQVARLTRSASEFGGQLDSLADMITFGVAPAVISWELVVQSGMDTPLGRLTAFCGMYAACAMIRLARFNVENDPDPSFHMSFAGLPSPAAAGVIASMVIVGQIDIGQEAASSPMINESSFVTMSIPYVTLALGILMVSRLPYPHLIQRIFAKDQPFGFLVVCVMVFGLAFYSNRIEWAFAGILIVYALSGPVMWARNRFRIRHPDASEEEEDEPIF